MSFPTPTIFTYRVLWIRDPFQKSSGFYRPEYSLDAGVTWLPLHEFNFDSKNEAMNSIAFTVENEVQFRNKIVAKNKTPLVTVLAYPPV